MKPLFLLFSVLLMLQESPARLQGVVTDAATGQPLAGIRVGATTIEVRDAPLTPVRIVASMVTDAEGRFDLSPVAPGRYRVWAEGNDYSRQEAGSALSGGAGQKTGVAIEVATGQSIRGLTIRMARAGSVAGRIAAATGQALVGIQVFLLRTRYNPDGRQYLETEASGYTDDRGQYRLSGIGPGRYYFAARSAIQMMPREYATAFGVNAPEPSPGLYPTTYFPGVSDASQAAMLEVVPGAETGGTDLVLSPSRGYRIRGAITEEARAGPPLSVGFTLLPKPPVGPVVYAAIHGPGYDRNTGTFDLTFPGSPDGFPSGRYWLIVARTGIGGEPRFAGLEGDRPVTRVSVDVAQGDVDNVQVIIRKPVPLQGRVSMDDGGTLPEDISSLDLVMAPQTDLPWASTLGAPISRHTTVAADGRFQYENVIPDSYDVVVSGLPKGTYLKSLKLGGANIFSSPLTIMGPTKDALDVVLSTKVGRIDGLLRDGSAQGVPYCEVVLVPDTVNRRDFYRTAVTDGQGAFGFDSVAPGAYKLFAWESPEPFAYFDQQFMSRFEDAGTAVSVEESARLRVSLSAR